MVSDTTARAIWQVHFHMLHALPAWAIDQLLDKLTDAELVEFCRQDQKNDAADRQAHTCRPNAVECVVCHGDGTGTPGMMVAL